MRIVSVLFLALQVSAGLKFLALNDVHLNLDYTGMPKLGGTASKDFLDFVFQDAAKYLGDDFDGILFPGDNCDHGVKDKEIIH